MSVIRTPKTNSHCSDPILPILNVAGNEYAKTFLGTVAVFQKLRYHEQITIIFYHLT